MGEPRADRRPDAGDMARRRCDLGAPLTLEYATEGNFGPRGGARIYPEFIGLLLALSFYTATYIGELYALESSIGLQGQTEAAYSLEFRPG